MEPPKVVTLEMELKYQRIFLELKQKITTGVWPIGAKIPTEMELCKKYAVSRITIRRALEALVDINYINRVRGRGSFVIGNKAATEQCEGLFCCAVRQKYRHLSNKILQITTHSPQSPTARYFQLHFLQDGSAVSQYRLIRKVEDKPYALINLFMSEAVGELLEGCDWSQKSFIELYCEQTGIPVCHVVRQISALIPNRESCDLLGVEYGTAHLWQHSSSQLEDRSVVGMGYGIFNNNLYNVVIDSTYTSH